RLTPVIVILSRLRRCTLPRSTLFPYTTLFRSSHIHPGGHKGAVRSEELDTTVLAIGHVHRALRVDRDPVRDLKLTGAGPGLSPGDRKSTRLNSSHGSISYAVFCLKKKNKDTTT